MTGTFVLVHPAWHGAWCWKKVVPFLRRPGHDVFTPTLTGLGERSHLLRRDITFDTHVQDVVNLLIAEDLSGVVLVAHSSSGAVITAVAEVVADRIAHVVYLDALRTRRRTIGDRSDLARTTSGAGGIGPDGGQRVAASAFRPAAVGNDRARHVGRARRKRFTLDVEPSGAHTVHTFF